MMRLYEQGSSHRLKAVGFRLNYVGGIFYELHAATSLQYLHHNCGVDVQCRLPVLSSSGQAFSAIVATNSFLLFFV